jgi:hypothetical protein
VRPLASGGSPSLASSGDNVVLDFYRPTAVALAFLTVTYRPRVDQILAQTPVNFSGQSANCRGPGSQTLVITIVTSRWHTGLRVRGAKRRRTTTKSLNLCLPVQ